MVKEDKQKELGKAINQIEGYILSQILVLNFCQRAAYSRSPAFPFDLTNDRERRANGKEIELLATILNIESLNDLLKGFDEDYQRFLDLIATDKWNEGEFNQAFSSGQKIIFEIAAIRKREGIPEY